MVERFQIGVIASPHGLHGEVNVFPTTDDPQRFRRLKRLTVDSKRDGEQEKEIEGVKFSGKFVVLKLAGWDTIDDVQRLRGCALTVPRKDAIPLAEGEYYSADLIGLAVYDEEGRRLGTLTEVLRTGANDVYAMERTDGGGEALLPAIRECIREISVEDGRMVIHVMDGLL